MGTLYYGDNLDILRRYLKDETVDLVYLDPPFNSAANYNAFFQEKDGTAAASQIQAFEDTWSWNIESESAYKELTEQPGKVSEVMQAFRTFLGQNDMMAYLAMMAPRLVELRRVLKPAGSLYLHCDPTASHYLKLLLDAVFGGNNFSNEIIWKRTSTKNDYKQGAVNWPRVHDTIVMYYKSVDAAREAQRYHQQFEPYDEKYLETFYTFKDPDGRRYRLSDLTAPGQGSRGHPKFEFLGVTRHWRYNKEKMERLHEEGRIEFRKTGSVPMYKRYLDEMPGVSLGDVWTDIRGMINLSSENLGYPTQKPVALLERILNTSTNTGEMVLDPFCGCGTTIDAAEKLGRKWIGIDITQLATSLIKNRLRDTYGENIEIITIGEPTTPNEANALAEQDKYQFQWWALGLVGARPVEQKKGADHGIDGKILFRDDPKAAKPESIVIQVKGGGTSVKDVRDLRGVLDREKAAIGVLITLQAPTKPMLAEAASAGFYTHKLNGQQYAKLQLRTVKELMEGKGIERPSSVSAVDETFKKAPKAQVKDDSQQDLI
jgi:DNA modification methylase